VSGEPEIARLIVVLTARCNMLCTYCYQTARKPVSMRWEVLRASIDVALKSALPQLELMFIGGEPLLEWGLIRNAVAYANDQAPRGKTIEYRISTNGLLITDEIEEFLDRHRFGIQLSFDGVAGAQDYRQKGSFPILDDFLERLRSRRPLMVRERLKISTVQVPATIPYLAESVGYFMGKDVGEIAISPCLTPSSGWTGAGLEAMEDQFRQVFDRSLRRLEEQGDVPLTLFRKPCDGSGRDDDYAGCSAVHGKALAVDADGQAYGCVLFAESYRENHPDLLERQLAPLRLGEVTDPSFCLRHEGYRNAVAHVELFGDSRMRYSSFGRCAECPYRESCRVCPVSIGLNTGNGDPHRVPDFICAFNRVALKYREMFPPFPNSLQRLNALLNFRIRGRRI
jgi:sulfatase maturation enzyme AslB (radical SAM superfamily)